MAYNNVYRGGNESYGQGYSQPPYQPQQAHHVYANPGGYTATPGYPHHVAGYGQPVPGGQDMFHAEQDIPTPVYVPPLMPSKPEVGAIKRFTWWEGLGMYWKLEHQILSIFYNRLHPRYTRNRRVLHILFVITVLFMISFVVESTVLNTMKQACSDAEECWERCPFDYRGTQAGDVCTPFPYGRGDGQWYVYPIGQSTLRHKCHTPKTTICKTCREFLNEGDLDPDFWTQNRRDTLCGDSNDSICPHPDTQCFGPAVLLFIKAAIMFIVVSPLSWLVTKFLKGIGANCCATFISFIGLVATFAVAIIALFILAGIIGSLPETLLLFFTSYALTLVLEFPKLMLFYMCGGKGNMEKRIHVHNHEEMVKAANERNAARMAGQMQ